MEYYELYNFFINKVIESRILINESTSIELIFFFLYILISAMKIINQKFLSEYIEQNCFDNIKKIFINYSLDKKSSKKKILF